MNWLRWTGIAATDKVSCSIGILLVLLFSLLGAGVLRRTDFSNEEWLWRKK
jgi:hypothetical protein